MLSLLNLNCPTCAERSIVAYLTKITTMAGQDARNLLMEWLPCAVSRRFTPLAHQNSISRITAHGEALQGPVSEFHKAFRLYENQDENAWRRPPVPVIATRVRLQSTQWHLYCFWRHSSPIYFEISSIWCPTERPLKILDCGCFWLKLVSEGENELIINVICTALAHNDLLWYSQVIFSSY